MSTLPEPRDLNIGADVRPSYYVIEDDVLRSHAANAQRNGRQDRKDGRRLRLWLVADDEIVKLAFVHGWLSCHDSCDCVVASPYRGQSFDFSQLKGVE